MLIIATLFFSCKNEKKEVVREKIAINAKIAETVILDSLAVNTQYLNLELPKDAAIGEITHIKAYNEYLFIHDQFQTKSISIVDTLGNFINQLKSIGRGPGEYSNIDAFSFDLENQVLIVYDRNLNAFNYYSFPDLQYVKTKTKGVYLMNFEVLDSENWFVVSDEKIGKEKYRGIEIWNKDLNAQTSFSSMGDYPSSIDISYPNTTSIIDNNVYYAFPNEFTTIYKVNEDDLIPIIDIDFGDHKITSDYWKLDDPNKFEESLTSGPEKATWVQNFIMNENRVAFWFLYKVVETRFLAFYNRNSKTSKVFSDVYVVADDVLLNSPVGIINNHFISVIYPESIESSNNFSNAKLNSALETNRSNAPLLLLYKLKDSLSK